MMEGREVDMGHIIGNARASLSGQSAHAIEGLNSEEALPLCLIRCHAYELNCYVDRHIIDGLFLVLFGTTV
jgi:hypothetical protein